MASPVPPAPKRRGRPPGSKNKPRPPAPANVPANVPAPGAPAPAPAPASAPEAGTDGLFAALGRMASLGAGPAPDAPETPPPPPDPNAQAAEFLRTADGLRMASNLYRLPWEAVSRGSGVDVIPPDESLTAGGRALRDVLLLYGGDFLRYLPLVNLAACLAGDGFSAYRKIAAANEKKRKRPSASSGSSPAEGSFPAPSP